VGLDRLLEVLAVGVVAAAGVVAAGVLEGRRVGEGVEVAVETERVLGTAHDRVDRGEGTEARAVVAGAHVVQRGRARQAGRADVEPALVFPALLADRGRAACAAPRRDRLAVGVVAGQVGEARLGLNEAGGDVAVEIGDEPVDGRADLDPQPVPRRGDDAVGRETAAVGDPDDLLAGAPRPIPTRPNEIGGGPPRAPVVRRLVLFVLFALHIRRKDEGAVQTGDVS
jgi:hypothetical protein